MGHDKLATRLSILLFKLNQGERVTVEALAEEFGVSKRTIERDIARFSYFNIEKEGKEYYLDEVSIGKLNFDDIKNFAIFSGINSLFPSLTQQFLKDILDEKINRAYMIQNSGFEDIAQKQELFGKLSSAILDEKIISFFYNDKKRDINPYKMVNINGIWYLLATENKIVKTFTFSKIKNLYISNDKFSIDKNILQEIEKNEINFLSSETKEVHLKIDNSAKEYFLRKKTLSNMNIIDNTEDYFIVSTTISFDDEIINLAKQWIPYIQIIQPIELQKKLEDILKKYLNK